MEGYATPAALVFTLALAFVAAALVQRGSALLRLSRADLETFRLQAALDGAQLNAVAEVIRSGAGGPYHWTLSTDVGLTDVVVESEALKLSLKSASELGDSSFAAFGVQDIDALKGRLNQADAQPAVTDVGSLDAAPLWQACGASLISKLGVAQSRQAVTWQEPTTTAPNPAWRVGELWRVSITTPAGWRDDRIVRFTGDALHPAAIVVRRWSRGNGGQEQCDAALAAAG